MNERVIQIEESARGEDQRVLYQLQSEVTYLQEISTIDFRLGTVFPTYYVWLTHADGTHLRAKLLAGRRLVQLADYIARARGLQKFAHTVADLSLSDIRRTIIFREEFVFSN